MGRWAGVLFGRSFRVFGSLYWVPRIWDWVQVPILTTLQILRSMDVEQKHPKT